MTLDPQSLFWNAPAAICVLRGPEHAFVLANEAYEKLAGRKVEIGTLARAAFPEAERQGFIALLDAVYRTGKPYVGTEVPLELDGKRSHLNFVYQPFREQGQVAGIFVHVYDVTDLVEARADRERLARSLRESDAILRASQEVSPLGFSHFRIHRDPAGNACDFEYLFQNAAASRINRQGEGTSCAGKRTLEVFPGLKDASLFTRYKRVADTGVPWQGEERYKGEHLDSWFRITAVRSSPDTMSLAYEDITARHQLEERFERLHALIASLSAARSIADVAEVAAGAGAQAIGAATAALATLEGTEATVIAAHGVSKQVLQGFGRFQLTSQTPIAEAMRTGAEVIVEDVDEFRRRYPELLAALAVPYQSSAAYPLLSAGRLVGGIGFRFDKPRVLGEADRQFLSTFAGQVGQALERAALFDAATRARAELAAQKKRLDVILHELPVGVLVVGSQRQLILQNRAAASIWGAPARLEESRSRYARHVAYHADGRPVLEGEWPSVQILEGKVFPPEEVRIVRADGAQGWVALNGAPILGEDGQVEAAVVALSDVTRIKEAEARASAASAEARSASRAKDEFLAMLGHELRNPLTPIVTALSLMRLRGDSAHERERAVIERQVEHLTRLVDDLLDISRITGGKIELRFGRVVLQQVVAHAVEGASPLFEKKAQQLEVHAPHEPLAVSGDLTRLSQIVSNLLANAGKYTERGGRVAVTLAREEGLAVLRVQDNGIGISPQMLPRVFDLFAQERQAIDRAEGGLGLGLSIVKTLVAAHGGTVEARSEGRGRGSEFVVRLPLFEGAAEAPAQPDKRDDRLPILRVLVVDDNVDGAELLAEATRMMGCDTRVAHDGPTALAIVQAGFAPDVALLDIGLPVMDGHELGARLRQLEAGREVLLVAITGYGQPADREKSAASGFYAHLAKPVTIEQVRATLLSMASRRR